MRLLTTALAILVFSLSPAPTFAAPVPVLVDTCGQVLPPKAAGYLAANLDCSAYGGIATVSLGKKATLDLGGFTLTTDSPRGIDCNDGGCTVRNGVVTGAGEIGIVGIRMLIENVTVSMSGLFALSLGENSTLRGSTVDGTATIGLHSSGGRKTTKIIDSTITGHRNLGVWVFRAKLMNSVVTGNLNNPDCANGLTCADLFTARRPTLKDSTCGRSAVQGLDTTPGCQGWCLCTSD